MQISKYDSKNPIGFVDTDLNSDLFSNPDILKIVLEAQPTVVSNQALDRLDLYFESFYEK